MSNKLVVNNKPNITNLNELFNYLRTAELEEVKEFLKFFRDVEEVEGYSKLMAFHEAGYIIGKLSKHQSQQPEIFNKPLNNIQLKQIAGGTSQRKIVSNGLTARKPLLPEFTRKEPESWVPQLTMLNIGFWFVVVAVVLMWAVLNRVGVI